MAGRLLRQRFRQSKIDHHRGPLEKGIPGVSPRGVGENHGGSGDQRVSTFGGYGCGVRGPFRQPLSTSPLSIHVFSSVECQTYWGFGRRTRRTLYDFVWATRTTGQSDILGRCPPVLVGRRNHVSSTGPFHVGDRRGWYISVTIDPSDLWFYDTHREYQV